MSKRAPKIKCLTCLEKESAKAKQCAPYDPCYPMKGCPPNPCSPNICCPNFGVGVSKTRQELMNKEIDLNKLALLIKK